MALEVYDNLSVSAIDFSELSCKECAKSGRNIDSLNFCVECKSLYCLECLQNHQEDGNLGRNHKWKNKTINNGFNQGIPSELENNNNNGYHSMACMIQQQQENKIRKDIKSQLEQLRIKLNQMMDAETAATQQRLETLRANTEHKLDNFNSCIKNLVDEIKSMILNNINSIHKEIEDQFSVKVATLTRLQTKTEAALKKINETKSNNDLDELVAVANQTKEDTYKIEQDPENYYSKISENVKRAERRTLDAALLDEMDGFICHIHALVQCLSVNKSDEDLDTRSNTMPFADHNVRAESDISVCDINSSCSLKDGSIILTDWNNSNIKWLNENFDIINVCTLPGIPWAVNCYSDNEVLVSLHLLQRIQWVTFQGDQMMLGKSFMVKNPCKGIACCLDKIFVSCGGNNILECPGQIQVYNSDGYLIQTYLYDHSGNPIFSNPQHLVVAISKSKYMLYIADKDFGLISIDTGKDEPYLRHNTSTCIKKIDMKEKVLEAKGLCLKTNKSIFLCDFKLGNIVEIEYTQDDHIVRSIITSQHNITNPNSVCFNEKQMKLIVTRSNTSEIRVYDLKKWRHCYQC